VAIHSLSAELVDVVLEYGIGDTNPPATEDIQTYDLAASAKPDDAEKLGVVNLGSFNAKSEPEAKTHHGRLSAMKWFASKLSKAKTKLAAPAENK
jgi:hypothetical protein